MILTDFLLARIAEDEATARAATQAPWVFEQFPEPRHGLLYGHVMSAPAESGMGTSYGEVAEGFDGASPKGPTLIARDAEHIVRHDPARVLSECEAKRRIVERFAAPDVHSPDERCEACATLYDLASAYADHEDFREEWRA